MPTPLQRTRFILGQPSGPYLFREEFPTAHAAGTLASYNAEPGPGRWAAVDTNAKLSITGGALTGVTGGAGNFDPAIVGQTPISRIPGRLLLVATTVTANRTQVGWLSQRSVDPAQINPNRRGMIDLNTTTLAVAQTSAGSITVGTVALSTAYQLCVALRPSGTHYFIKGGAFANWTLLWVDIGTTNGFAYPTYCYLGTTTAFTCDYMRVPNSQFMAIPVASDGFGGSFGTTDGLGHLEGQMGSYGSGGGSLSWTQHIGTWGNSGGAAAASALSGGVAAATVNSGKTDTIVTAKVTRSAGVAGVLVAYVDASNHVRAVHDGTNAQLIKRVSGADTNLISTAATYSAGAEIRVSREGTAYRLYYNNVLIGSQQTISDSVFNSVTRQGLYTTNTGNTFDDFTVYDRGTGGAYVVLDSF